MTDERYPTEHLDPEDEDDGTMPENVAELEKSVIGHRIVSAERGEVTTKEHGWEESDPGLILTLDNGTRVSLHDTYACCAYTSLQGFFAHPEMVDHVILGVGTTGGYTKWHIYADFGDVMKLDVGWSCGNPFYYAYGFDIAVEEVVPPSETPKACPTCGGSGNPLPGAADPNMIGWTKCGTCRGSGIDGGTT